MTNAAELDRWVYPKSVHLENSGNCRLFCFPYAGAGASVYRNWQQELPSTIEVVPIQLPGRESRWSDQAIPDLSLLATTLATALHPLLSEPYALFGHSMGALIAFELARVLRRRKLPPPMHLFISAARAPHIPDREPPVHHLPDVLLWKTVTRDYGAAQDGTPLNPEMASVLASHPTCRLSDVRILQALLGRSVCLSAYGIRRLSRPPGNIRRPVGLDPVYNWSVSHAALSGWTLLSGSKPRWLSEDSVRRPCLPCRLQKDSQMRGGIKQQRDLRQRIGGLSAGQRQVLEKLLRAASAPSP